jgi:hypothetical protein
VMKAAVDTGGAVDHAADFVERQIAAAEALPELRSRMRAYIDRPDFDRATYDQLAQPVYEAEDLLHSVPGVAPGFHEDEVVALVPTLRQAAERLRRGEKPPSGHTYEVDIDADPEQFLDWDKPLSEQSPQVREALADPAIPALANYEAAIRAAAKTPQDAEQAITIAREMIAGKLPRTGDYAHWKALETYAPGVDHNAIHDIAWLGEKRGQQIYRDLDIDDDATDTLRRAGIPGIRYLDQGSRDAGKGTSNYVVFDDKLISILRKYGLIPLGQVGAPQPEEREKR